MCALDGYLYAFGGWVGEDIGGTIERYNPIKDQWEYLTKMQEPRFSMGICVYDSLIYLVGGCTHSRRHMQELVSYNPVIIFSNFSCMFLNPNNFFSLNSNCSNLLDLRNLKQTVKKAYCYQKLFWPFTVRTNCSSDLNFFANSRPSVSKVVLDH